MSHSLILLENASYKAFSTSFQAHLETLGPQLPGARLESILDLRDFFARPASDKNAVLIVPIALPLHKKEISRILVEVKRHRPSAFYYAVQFILSPSEKNFDPGTFSDPSWTEILDSFYDEAVPSSFVVFHRDSPQVQIFQAVASLTGLLRDLDAARELERLGVILEELESRTHTLENAQMRRLKEGTD